MAVDHDQRFKILLREFFREFFELFFPKYAALFDFSQIEWLDKEVFTDPPTGKRRYLDLLAKIPLRQALAGQRPGEANALLALIHVEIEHEDVSVILRVLPLLRGNAATGALVLMRDVSDLRRRDRMLLSKDATIREIHHRVKNNLQVITSLLNMQQRALTDPAARAAMSDTRQRITALALIYRALAQKGIAPPASGPRRVCSSPSCSSSR